tara:strand:+ start:5061 stop:6197 length:1137 start_codon:yes stop_codon:yes gene_type:complete
VKVILLNSFSFPHGKATSNRLIIFAKELLKIQSFKEVSIIGVDEKFSQNVIESIKFINIKHKKSEKFFFLRALNEILLSLKLWNRILKEKPDVLLISIPSFFLIFPLIFLSKNFYLIIDVRDVVWKYLKGSFYKRFASIFLKSLFSLSLKKSNLVSVTNQKEFDLISDSFAIKPLVINNGISYEDFDLLSKIPLKEINKPNIISYIGNIGLAQDLDFFLHSISTYSNVEINFIGDGNQLKELKRISKKYKDIRVNFLGFVAKSELKNYFSKSDILFASIGENFDSAVPTKIFEYIASGRLVLLGLPNGPAREIFEKFLGVEIFYPRDKDSFNQAFKKLIEKKFNEKMRLHNLNILKSDFIREISAKRLAEYIVKDYQK